MTIKPSEMMKHICLPILCAACAFVSCVSRRVAEQTVVQRDSLEAVVRAKDSLIEVVFADINAVTENLARIRTRENLVALARNDEGVRRPIEEIDADIVAIDRLLQENRQKIAALQRSSAQLRKADLRIEGLEKMIRGLDAQLTAKVGEIGRLRGELSQMEARMETLAEEAAPAAPRSNTSPAKRRSWRTGSTRSIISWERRRRCAIRGSSRSRGSSGARSRWAIPATTICSSGPTPAR